MRLSVTLHFLHPVIKLSESRSNDFLCGPRFNSRNGGEAYDVFRDRKYNHCPHRINFCHYRPLQ